MDRESARFQFDNMNNRFDIEHTFPFDEAWDFVESHPDFNPLKHTFCKNQYVREIFNPAGQILITKIHKVEHPFFLLKGEMSILSEEGEINISAPYYGITPVGTKRVIYAHTDCTFVTVHPTDKKDLDELEQELIAKDYKELEKI